MADLFEGINATADAPGDGSWKLKELISDHIYGLNVPQKYLHTVRNQTIEWIDLWKHYQDAENQVVEVWAQFWLYRKDGQLQWDIKVVWDADGPDSRNPRAHYGYEVYLDGERKAGPGHVYFTKCRPEYIRDGEKMHEVHRGLYTTQFWDTPEEQYRLDCALRLWACGKDVEIDEYAMSDQEYYKMLWEAPQSWRRFPRPSFGQIA